MPDPKPAVCSIRHSAVSRRVRQWGMFHLITLVKRGSASSLPGTWPRYPDIDAARAAAGALLREDRVQRVIIARDEAPKGFVEWRDRQAP